MSHFSIIAVFTDPTLDFTGNTSAVVLTEKSLAEVDMKQLAADFNQPATTFLWPSESANTYSVRWLAPDEEIGLCGHGSLAAIAYLAHYENLKGKINLQYKGGSITGFQNNDGSCSMELDAIPVTGEEEPSDILIEALGIPVKAYFTTRNKHIVVIENESDLARMKPDFAKLRELDVFGYSVTATGSTADFVSRTLVPHVQQLEDHATGSSHAALAPFWSNRLAKSELTAHQLSKRGGKFICQVKGDSVILKGRFHIVAEGHIII